MQHDSTTNTEQLTDRWMVWYADDAVQPIAVRAADRATARSIGRRARDEVVTAVINEREGAESDLNGIEDAHLSTETDPERFIRETY